MADLEQEDLGDVSDHHWLRGGVPQELREMQEEYNRGVNGSVDHYFIPRRQRRLTRKQLVEAAVGVLIVGAAVCLAILLAAGGR